MRMAFWRLRTKAQDVIIWTIIFVSLAILLFVSYLKASKPQSVTEFGSMKVGGFLPSFVGVSESGKKIGSTYPKGGKFYIHVVDEQLPTSCLDLECGEQSRIVVNKGGHLIGGSDFKYAKIFGIKIVKNSTLINRILYHLKPFAEKFGWKIQVFWWRPETSLVVVADGKGRIIHIYKNGGIKDVPRIVRNLKLDFH